MQLPSPIGPQLTLPAPTQVPVIGVIGYNPGQGLSVSQPTSKSTGIAVNSICGDVTTFDDALSAGAIVQFSLSSVFAKDGLIGIATHVSGGTKGAYTVVGGLCSGGAFTVSIRNNTGGSLAEALQICFFLFRCPGSNTTVAPPSGFLHFNPLNFPVSHFPKDHFT